MRSSAATGLFQFIEQTWLSTLKPAGPAFGYGHLRAARRGLARDQRAVEQATAAAAVLDDGGREYARPERARQRFAQSLSRSAVACLRRPLSHPPRAINK